MINAVGILCLARDRTESRYPLFLITRQASRRLQMSKSRVERLYLAVFLPDFPAFQKWVRGTQGRRESRPGREEERIWPAKWAFFSVCNAKTLENKGFHESKHALGLALLDSASKEHLNG